MKMEKIKLKIKVKVLIVKVIRVKESLIIKYVMTTTKTTTIYSLILS